MSWRNEPLALQQRERTDDCTDVSRLREIDSPFISLSRDDSLPIDDANRRSLIGYPRQRPFLLFCSIRIVVNTMPGGTHARAIARAVEIEGKRLIRSELKRNLIVSEQCNPPATERSAIYMSAKPLFRLSSRIRDNRRATGTRGNSAFCRYRRGYHPVTLTPVERREGGREGGRGTPMRPKRGSRADTRGENSSMREFVEREIPVTRDITIGASPRGGKVTLRRCVSLVSRCIV